VDTRTEEMRRCELITATGQIDSSTAPALDETLQGLIRSGKRNLVINLRDVPFVSTAGLRVLMVAQITVRRMIPAGSVVISECSAQLKSTFELVGFHHQFRFYDNDTEAVGSF
jgi:stage II sporulation protein AA (anti-sigma F factor antagonist)